ncbi:MAG: winged helix-turn-helix transcriptional regulator [Candidatus Aenigmarchaeota archaeon]|nr:winged helix-turn-helix transcriptional regulator [Candidatus Aenigmarchaeota archaeon]
MSPRAKKWLLPLSGLAVMLFLVIFFFNISEVKTFEKPSKIDSNFSGANKTEFRYVHIPLFYRLILSPALLMIATVLTTYYFISRRLEEQLEKNMALILKLINKNNSIPKTSIEKVDHNTILRFLNASERKILEKLIENKGTTLQSEISRMPGMNKLKTHRAIKDLERKGILKTESHGKTNLIILDNDIRNTIIG